MTSVWKAIHTIVKHFVFSGDLKWLSPWRLVIGFNFRIFRADCVVSPWIYNSTIRRRRNRRLFLYITFETRSLSPVRQTFLCSSHLKGVRTILKIITTFWPGFIFPNQSSKSSAALLLPTLFPLLLHFQYCRDACVNWINSDAGWFAALHHLSWVFFLCTLTRFDIQLIFLLELKLICGCLKRSEELTSKRQPGIRRLSFPQGLKSVIPPTRGRWVTQGYENVWLSLSDHHPALASTSGLNKKTSALYVTDVVLTCMYHLHLNFP